MPPPNKQNREAKQGGEDEAAAIELLDAVACLPELKDDAEAAGLYICGLLHLTQSDAAEGHLPRSPPPSADKATRAAASLQYCAAAYRWCLRAIRDPSALPQDITSHLKLTFSPKAAQLVCGELGLGAPSQPLFQPSPPLFHLLNCCWTVDRPFHLVAVASAFAWGAWGADGRLGTALQQLGVVVVRTLLAALQALDGALLAALLRSVHRLILARPELISVVCQSGALASLAKIVGAGSKAQPNRACIAAAHLIAGIFQEVRSDVLGLTNPFLLRDLKRLARGWSDMAPQFYRLLGADLGTYARGDQEAAFATRGCLVSFVEVELVPAQGIGAALVRLLRVCLQSVPVTSDIGNYYAKLRDAYNWPRHLSGPQHLECLRQCLGAMGTVSLEDDLMAELVAAGVAESLEELFCRKLPAVVLEDACILVGVLWANASTSLSGVQDMLDFHLPRHAAELLPTHFKRVCKEGKPLYGAPFALFCAASKIRLTSPTRIAWFSVIQDALLKYDSQSTCSKPSKWYGLATLCHLTDKPGPSMTDDPAALMASRLLEKTLTQSQELGRMFAAEVADIAGRIKDWETSTADHGREVDPQGKPYWANEADNLLSAIEHACRESTNAARMLVEDGLLEGFLREFESGGILKDPRGLFSGCPLLQPLFSMLSLAARASPEFRRRCQESKALAESLREGVGLLSRSTEAAARKGGNALDTPSSAYALIEFVSVMWPSSMTQRAPCAPEKRALVKMLTPVAVALWDASTAAHFGGLSGSRKRSAMLSKALMELDALNACHPLPSRASELPQMLRNMLNMECEWGAGHFANHSDQCAGCKVNWSEATGNLLRFVGYGARCAPFAQQLSEARVPQELDQVVHVLKRHLLKEPWAPDLMRELQATKDLIAQNALAARKSVKLKAERAPAAAKPARDMVTAEARARAAEAALLAELEQEERAAQKKQGKKKGKASSAAEGGSAGSAAAASGGGAGKGKGAAASKKKKKKQKQAAPAAKAAARRSVGDDSGVESGDESEKENEEGDLGGEDEKQQGAPAPSGTAGSAGAPAGAQEAAGGVSEEARRGYEMMMKMLAEAQQEEEAVRASALEAAAREHRRRAQQAQRPPAPPPRPQQVQRALAPPPPPRPQAPSPQQQGCGNREQQGPSPAAAAAGGAGRGQGLAAASPRPPTLLQQAVQQECQELQGPSFNASAGNLGEMRGLPAVAPPPSPLPRLIAPQPQLPPPPPPQQQQQHVYSRAPASRYQPMVPAVATFNAAPGRPPAAQQAAAPHQPMTMQHQAATSYHPMSAQQQAAPYQAQQAATPYQPQQAQHGVVLPGVMNHALGGRSGGADGGDSSLQGLLAQLLPKKDSVVSGSDGNSEVAGSGSAAAAFAGGAAAADGVVTASVISGGAVANGSKQALDQAQQAQQGLHGMALLQGQQAQQVSEVQPGEGGQGSMAAAGMQAGGAQAAYDDEALYQVLTCPITKSLFSDPVIASDGWTYERVAITAWLKQRSVSPHTGQPMSLAHLRPNHAARSAMESLLGV